MSSIDTTRRHYRDLLESNQVEGEHPADRIVADLPEVHEVDEAIRTMSADMRKSVMRRRSMASWTEYEDLRFQQRCIREERFFDVGYEMGTLAAIAQHRAFEQGAEATILLRELQRVLVASSLSVVEQAAVLLGIAQALLGSSRASHGNPGR
jgi:hypothetical protein